MIHSFSDTEVGGNRPPKELVEGSDGNFYGTTAEGGSANHGTFFRINTAGDFKVLHSFDAGSPSAELIKLSDGSFYGTNANGGSLGKGVIFRITAEGECNVIHHFDGDNGGKPQTGLIRGVDGFLYGTTPSYQDVVIRNGVAVRIRQQGTIFRINEAGVHTVIHRFELEQPNARLVQGRDGSLYGITSFRGAIFRITLDGVYRVIDSLDRSVVVSLGSGVVVAADGDLWGISNDGNTIYRFRLGPLVDTLPADGVTRSSAILHGRLNSATRMTFFKFQYGTDPDLDYSESTFTEDAFIENGKETVPVAIPVSSLKPNTTYYYRIWATDFSRSLSDIGNIFSFTTSLAEPQITAVYSSLKPGTLGTDLPAGAIWGSYGIPARNSNGKIAFVGCAKLPTGGILTGIFSGQPNALELLVLRGDLSTGTLETAGMYFSSFKEPILNAEGKVAFIGTVSARGRTLSGIWSNAGIERGGVDNLLALQGSQAAGTPVGVRWKTFTSLTLSDSGVVSFTATLAQGSGGVNRSNDFGLWQATPSKKSLLLREGQQIVLDGVSRTVKCFVALFSTQGQVSAEGTVPVRITFSDNTQALLGLRANGEPEVIAASDDSAPGTIESRFHLFGLPGFNRTGHAAFKATLLNRVGDSSPANNRGVFVAKGETMSQVARRGDIAPGVTLRGAPARFASFADPFINDEGHVAFVGTTSGNVKGLWWKTSDTGNLQLVASTQATDVPGIPGAGFRAFRSVALPDGERFGPMFVAQVAGRGISAANDMGVWAVDSEGDLRLLLREGQRIEGKILRAFTVLAAAPGSPAQVRSYNNDGQVPCRALFTDGTQMLLSVQIP